MDDVYELYTRGTELLEAGHNHQATIPLARARFPDPDKTSIREALGRALFGAQRYEQAVVEVQAVIDRGADQRLRLVLSGPLAPDARPPRRGPQAARPGRRDAARPARLPHRPRPCPRPRRAAGDWPRLRSGRALDGPTDAARRAAQLSEGHAAGAGPRNRSGRQRTRGVVGGPEHPSGVPRVKRGTLSALDKGEHRDAGGVSGPAPSAILRGTVGAPGCSGGSTRSGH